jgi:hypothetical protein
MRAVSYREVETFAITGDPKARPRGSKGIEAGGRVTERVADRVTGLGDDARVRAYETLGDRPKAVRIMERRQSVDRG